MSISTPMYNATAQRFNVQYDHNLKRTLQQRPGQHHQAPENWHVKQRELLFASTKTKHRRSPALGCISNLAGATNDDHLKFVGIAATDVNETKLAHGFAAFRQGIATITNTGNSHIYAGEHVYWQLPERKTPHVPRGAPPDKHVAVVVGENDVDDDKGRRCIGQALCGAEPGQPLDIVMFTTTCCKVEEARRVDGGGNGQERLMAADQPASVGLDRG